MIDKYEIQPRPRETLHKTNNLRSPRRRSDVLKSITRSDHGQNARNFNGFNILLQTTMTPRKPNTRHRSQNSQSHLQAQVQPSDYESEAPFIAPPTRTNADLNLSVLRRYNPSIQTILSIAASAVIYNFVPPDANNSTPSWDRAEVEGTLFVCETFPNPATGKEGCCIVVLNKKSFGNLIIDLKEVQDVEDTREFLILRFRDRLEVREKVIGVFIHPDKEDTRELNSMLVKERWEATRERNEVRGDNYGESDGSYAGKQLDVNQLFAAGMR